ncbi:MAG: hypothetical protein LKF42_09900 [Streptococcaceae bacterium]|jgi:hypothetical protein|nr:hypothetical protein [Streptococcaceae bacterium]
MSRSRKQGKSKAANTFNSILVAIHELEKQQELEHQWIREPIIVNMSIDTLDLLKNHFKQTEVTKLSITNSIIFGKEIKIDDSLPFGEIKVEEVPNEL